MNADYLDFSVEEQENTHLIMHRQNKKMRDGTEQKQNKRKMQSN